MPRTVPDIHEAVAQALTGKASKTLCPAHDDQSPSLSVGPGTEQPVVFNCHAGCEPRDIVEKAGLSWEELCAPREPREPEEWAPGKQPGDRVTVYPYNKADGTLSFQVLRVDKKNGGKTIHQRHADSEQKSGWAWNLEGAERVIYRLPQVLEAVRNGGTIHVAEGEKCVHALLTVIPQGDEATTNPMGAGKWEDYYSEALAGANVIVYADSDEPGRSHARHVRESLAAHGCTVEIREAAAGMLPNGKPISDIADHIAAGKELSACLVTTPADMAAKARTGVDVLDILKRPPGKIDWVLDDTLARGERLILIGFEGQGKSTWCRQTAVMAAAGIHPFSHRLIDPRKVLFIDAENAPMQVQDSWSQLVGLAARHGRPVERGQLIVLEAWEEDTSLDTPAGAAWLEERVYAYQPDLIIMGPLTNMASRDLRDDEPVRKLRNAVTMARSVCGSAFIMEHHAPLKGPADRDRPLRPYGSSLFLKWPDYGFGLKPIVDLPGHFEWYRNRGPRVRSRIWPAYMREGTPLTDEWPWMETVLTPEQERVIGKVR